MHLRIPYYGLCLYYSYNQPLRSIFNLTFEGHSSNITGVGFHCDSNGMVTSSEDGELNAPPNTLLWTSSVLHSASEIGFQPTPIRPESGRTQPHL